MAIVIAGVILLIILVIAGSLTSCSAMGGGVGNVTLATSFTAQDDDILAVEDDYKDLEAELQRKIDNIETDYPDYDEYRYNLAEIGHNPYVHFLSLDSCRYVIICLTYVRHISTI